MGNERKRKNIPDRGTSLRIHFISTNNIFTQILTSVHVPESRVRVSDPSSPPLPPPPLSGGGGGGVRVGVHRGVDRQTQFTRFVSNPRSEGCVSLKSRQSWKGCHVIHDSLSTINVGTVGVVETRPTQKKIFVYNTTDF